MKYNDFAQTLTHARLGRYLAACGGDSRKAMTLYRRNLQLSQELFTVISCFEIALRNKIDLVYSGTLGADWLRDAAATGGIFDNAKCKFTRDSIRDAINKLHPHNTHNKLVAELGFGFWRFLYARHQFRFGGNTLLAVFPAKPVSTPAIQYNHTYIFHELQKINDIRNRIAHHEPICFVPGQPIKDTTYARQHYNVILQLFQWMNIDESALLYGLDHILEVCTTIDNL